MDRRQSIATSRRSISSITHEYVCVCVAVCVWVAHMKSEFSPQAKKKYISSENSLACWGRPTVSLPVAECVCVSVCVRVCARIFLWFFLVNFSIWRLLCACYKYRKIPLRILAQRREAAAGNLWWFSTHALALSRQLACTQEKCGDLSLSHAVPVPRLSLTLSFALPVSVLFSRRADINFPDSGESLATTPLCPFHPSEEKRWKMFYC